MLQLPTLVLFILLLFILLLPMGDDDDDDVGTTTANDDDDDDAVVAVPRRPGRKSRVGNVISLSLSLSFSLLVSVTAPFHTSLPKARYVPGTWYDTLVLWSMDRLRHSGALPSYKYCGEVSAT